MQVKHQIVAFESKVKWNGEFMAVAALSSCIKWS